MRGKRPPQFGPEEQAELEALVLEYQERQSHQTFRLLWTQLLPMLSGVMRELGGFLNAEEDPEEAWAAIQAALLQAVSDYRPVFGACSVALALERDVYDALRPRTRPAGRALEKESSFSEAFLESQERLATVSLRKAPDYQEAFANEHRDSPYHLIDQAVANLALTPLQRELLLAWAQDGDLAAVAAAKGISVGYAEKLLSLAKKTLREKKPFGHVRHRFAY